MKAVHKLVYFSVILNVVYGNIFLNMVIDRIVDIYKPQSLLYFADFNLELINYNKLPKSIFQFNESISSNILTNTNKKIIVIIISNSNDIIFKFSKFYITLESPIEALFVTQNKNIKNFRDEFISLGFWNDMFLSVTSEEMIWTNSLETISMSNIKSMNLPYPNFRELVLILEIPNQKISCKTIPFCVLLIDFSLKYNITFNITDGKSNLQSTINFVKTDSNYTFTRFEEYNSLDIYVPIKSELDNIMFFIEPFQGEAWLFIGTIIIVHVISESICYSKFNIVHTFSIFFAQRRLRRKSLIQLFFVIFSYLTSVLYSAGLGSSLFQKSYSISKTILCLEKFVKQYSVDSKTASKFKIVSEIEYWSHVNSANTTFGYCLGKGSTEKMLVYEKILKRKIFEKVDLGIKSVAPFTIIILKFSPFRKLFNNMLRSITTTGLAKKMDEYQIENLKNLVDNDRKDFGITFSKFVVPIQLYSFGIALTIILFIVEIIVNYISCLIRKRQKN